MREALKAAGLEGVPREHLEEGRYRGYLEAHIEQGGLLEAGEKRIGIVTAIVGIMQFRLTFSGIQKPCRHDAHADPQGCWRRHDAALQRRDGQFPAVSGPRSVWTVGKMSIEPGAPAIVPGRAEMILRSSATPTSRSCRRSKRKLMEIVARSPKDETCKVECVNSRAPMPR